MKWLYESVSYTIVALMSIMVIITYPQLLVACIVLATLSSDELKKWAKKEPLLFSE